MITLLTLVLIGLAARFYLTKHAVDDTRTLVENTNGLVLDTKKLVGSSNTLVENTNALLLMRSTLAASQSELNQVTAQLSHTQGTPELSSQMRRDLGDAAHALSQQMEMESLHYRHAVSTNSDRLGGPTPTRQELAEQQIRLNGINTTHAIAVHQLLDTGEHLRTLMNEGNALTAEDKQYAEIIQKGRDGNIPADQFPLNEVSGYFIHLADRIKPKSN